MCPDAVLYNKRNYHNEKPVHLNEKQALLPAPRQNPCSNKDPAQPKINKQIGSQTQEVWGGA